VTFKNRNVGFRVSYHAYLAHPASLPVLVSAVVVFATAFFPAEFLTEPTFANEISVSALKPLALDCPRIIGTKDTSRDMPRFQQLLHEIKPQRPEFACLIGWEELLCASLFMGGDGGTLSSAGVVPKVIKILAHRARTRKAVRQPDFLEVMWRQDERFLPKPQAGISRDFDPSFPETAKQNQIFGLTVLLGSNKGPPKMVPIFQRLNGSTAQRLNGSTFK
jgi:hypothetical protein